MKIRCIKILTNRPHRKDEGKQTEVLTVGREYIVLCVYYGARGVLGYQLESDRGDLIIFEADQFEVLTNYIPSNWEITTETFPDGTYYLELSPQRWNQAKFPRFNHQGVLYDDNFYEEITEQEAPLEQWRNDPTPVMQLYFEEKDLIYREEEEYKLKNEIK